MHDYTKEIHSRLLKAGIRSEIDLSNEKLGYKIRQTQGEKIPYMAVIGKKEKEEGIVSLRSRDDGDLGAKSIQELIDNILDETVKPNV